MGSPGFKGCGRQVPVDADVEGGVVAGRSADQERLVRHLQTLQVLPVPLGILQQPLQVVPQRLQVLPKTLELVSVAQEEVASGDVFDDGVASLHRSENCVY